MSTLVLVVALVAAGQTGQSPGVSAKCGSFCLFVALRSLDLIAEPYSRFEKHLPPPPVDGYSFGDLEQIAHQFGAHTLALEADLETLSRLDGRRACIAYLNQHFVIVSNIDKSRDTVSIIDPPARYNRTLQQFRRTYSQRALVIAPQPIAPPSSGSAWRTALGIICTAAAVIGLLSMARSLAGRRRLAGSVAALLMVAVGGCRPGNEGARGATSLADPPATVGAGPVLRIEPQHYHAGKILAASEDHKLSMRVQLINDSDHPIRITELQKSCVCTSIDLENSTVPSHGRTSLHASFSLGNTPGPDLVAITVRTSQPGDAERVITCDWDLVTPLHTVPERCGFGRLDLGARASARLELWNRGITFCRKCDLRVESDRRSVVASFEAGSPVTRVDGHADGDISLQEDRRLGTICLDVQPQSEAGDFARLVDVTVQCGGIVRGKLSLPVQFSVRPRIEVHPARLWLGFAPPAARIERRVSIRSNDGTIFRVASVANSSGPFQARASFPDLRAVETHLDLSLVAPEQSGVYRGELEICVEGETRSHLTLPVSLIVRSE
jgi:hypothetical protein